MNKSTHFRYSILTALGVVAACAVELFGPTGALGHKTWSAPGLAISIWLVHWVATKKAGAPTALLLLTALCLSSCRSLGPTPPPGTPGFVNCSDAAIHQAALGFLPAVENALATDNWESALLTIIAQDGGPLALAEVDCAVLWVESEAAKSAPLTADSLEATKQGHAQAWFAKHPVTFQ